MPTTSSSCRSRPRSIRRSRGSNSTKKSSTPRASRSFSSAGALRVRRAPFRLWSPSPARSRASAAPLRELLADDPHVVECEREPQELLWGEPTRVGGVVASADGSTDRRRIVENADGRAARVAPRIGINAEDGTDPRPDAGLLFDLARAGSFRRLARLAESPGERPLSLERRPAAADEEQSSAAILDPGIDGQPGCLREASSGQGRLPSASKKSRISCAGRREASSAGVSSYQSRGIRLT